MLGLVEQGHLHRRVAQRSGCEQAGEPAADDHYPPGTGCLRHHAPLLLLPPDAILDLAIAQAIAPMWVIGLAPRITHAGRGAEGRELACS